VALTELRADFALAAYPTIVIFIFDLGSPGSRWATRNRSSAVPLIFKQRDEARGRFLILVKYVLLLVVVWLLSGGRAFFARFLAGHSWPWLSVCLSGIIVGALAFGFQRTLAIIAPSIARAESSDYLSRGPVVVWLGIFAVGAIAEETWRASCIVGFGSRPTLADLLAAVAFSAAHMSGLPPRIPQGLGVAGAEAAVGLVFGALFIGSGSPLAPFLASIIYYTSNYFWLRRRYARVAQA
jgi:hypothetical protein